MWLVRPLMRRRVRPVSVLTSVITLLQVLVVSPALPAVNEADATAASRPATEVTEEYQHRFDALPADDVAGHYALAEWCSRQGRYDLLLRQAQYVLKLDPKNVNARLLQTIALRNLNDQRRAERPGKPRPGARDQGPLISKAGIQRLRFAELLDLRPASSGTNSPRESVTVRFDKGVLTDFLDAMSDVPEFQGEANRERFLSLTPTQRVQIIRQATGNTYADRIDILSDPLVFRRFRQVLPLIERGCAAIGCHGGDTPAKPFGLRSSLAHPDQSLYTQFLILDRVSVGRNRLIDRDNPQDSLLLQYGLPTRYAQVTHPTEIKPLYPQGKDDVNYKLVSDWIRLLRTPRPRIGIDLPGYPEPPLPGAVLLGQTPGSPGPSQPTPAPGPAGGVPDRPASPAPRPGS
jgi:hypothetical protein